MIDGEFFFEEDEIRFEGEGAGPQARGGKELRESLIESLSVGPSEEIGDVDAALGLAFLADQELRSYGTDENNKLRDPQIRLVLRALRSVAGRVGVRVEIPFRDFGSFRSYWGRNGATGSWQARRDILDGIFGEPIKELEDLQLGLRRHKIPSESLAGLREPAAILEQLERIQRSISVDPALAVGSAKELIESTAKVVLLERGWEVSDRQDLPDLVRNAQKSLSLHPSDLTPGPDGTNAIKKILGGVSSIAIGVAELRNRGYGTGHGVSGVRVGLGQRHAHLAVDAASTWCRLMLDTLADPSAPWRSRGD